MNSAQAYMLAAAGGVGENGQAATEMQEAAQAFQFYKLHSLIGTLMAAAPLGVAVYQALTPAHQGAVASGLLREIADMFPVALPAAALGTAYTGYHLKQKRDAEARLKTLAGGAMNKQAAEHLIYGFRDPRTGAIQYQDVSSVADRALGTERGEAAKRKWEMGGLGVGALGAGIAGSTALARRLSGKGRLLAALPAVGLGALGALSGKRALQARHLEREMSEAQERLKNRPLQEVMSAPSTSRRALLASLQATEQQAQQMAGGRPFQRGLRVYKDTEKKTPTVKKASDDSGHSNVNPYLRNSIDDFLRAAKRLSNEDMRRILPKVRKDGSLRGFHVSKV